MFVVQPESYSKIIMAPPEDIAFVTILWSWSGYWQREYNFGDPTLTKTGFLRSNIKKDCLKHMHPSLSSLLNSIKMYPRIKLGNQKAVCVESVVLAILLNCIY